MHRGDGKVCLLAVGKMVEAAEEAAAKLAADGIDATVWDVRVVAPPDPEMLADAAVHGLVVTVEDGIRVGGAGTFLLDAMRALPGVDRPLPPVRILGVPRSYVAQGKPDLILADLGLDGPGIASTVTAGPGRRARAAPPVLGTPAVQEQRPARPGRHAPLSLGSKLVLVCRGWNSTSPTSSRPPSTPSPTASTWWPRAGASPTPRWRIGPTAWPTIWPPRGCARVSTSASTP